MTLYQSVVDLGRLELLDQLVQRLVEAVPYDHSSPSLLLTQGAAYDDIHYYALRSLTEVLFYEHPSLDYVMGQVDQFIIQLLESKSPGESASLLDRLKRNYLDEVYMQDLVDDRGLHRLDLVQSYVFEAYLTLVGDGILPLS